MKLLSAVVLPAVIACSGAEQADAARDGYDGRTLQLLERELDRIDSAAAALDRIFQPLPLLTFTEESALRRYSNAQHLARARALGVPRGLSDERLRALQAEGRIIELEDSEYWVVRDLDRSRALAIPAVRSSLTDIGRRFQARLAALGALPLRLEISSALRTAADQAALRRGNPNAAQGESTHEFGTTFDVLYSAYSAPARPVIAAPPTGDASADSLLRRYADIAVERVAGRRALELKAVLGQVLLELQREGRILVTIERLQPVYHITVAR